MPELPAATVAALPGHLRAVLQQVVLRRDLRCRSSCSRRCAIGRFFWKKGDGALIDGLGPDNIAARAQDMAGVLMRFQSGYLYHYAFVMLVGVAGLVTYFMMSAAR